MSSPTVEAILEAEASNDKNQLRSLINRASIDTILEAFWDVEAPSPFYEYALLRIIHSDDAKAKSELLESAATNAEYAAEAGNLEILQFLAPAITPEQWVKRILPIAIAEGRGNVFDFALKLSRVPVREVFSWERDYLNRLDDVIAAVPDSKYVKELQNMRNAYDPLSRRVDYWESKAELAMNLHTTLSELDSVLDRIRRGEDYLAAKNAERAKAERDFLESNPHLSISNDTDLVGDEISLLPPDAILNLIDAPFVYRFSYNDFPALEEKGKNPYTMKDLPATVMAQIRAMRKRMAKDDIKHIITLPETLDTLLEDGNLPPRLAREIEEEQKYGAPLPPSEERLVKLLNPDYWSITQIRNIQTPLENVIEALEEYNLPLFQADTYRDLWQRLITYVNQNPQSREFIIAALDSVL
jgi:hypothetical protein